ncbi:MAG TPA: hypothetical protein VM802_20095 [Chitinophaga sp.]|uniref:hypothetical protein n=1 Tax=Chitinophaga sp. TaxID=1869181 RepID=UPI002C9FA3F2|nr:hypothetical protein [Chitinophaga sp.]HVI47190.1 hypothetical protein [Chitinophaga sp.]
MSETLHYIEDYFTGALSPEEKLAFEQRCTSDQAFAQDVAFYISARSMLREELHELKRQQFSLLKPAPAPVKRIRAIMPYLAAAVIAGVFITLGWWFFFRAPSTQQMATRYIDAHLQQLSVTMHSGSDSIQSGINAYNNKDYQHATAIFSRLSTQEATAADATRYLGLVYLATGQYDQAIVQFNALMQFPLYANPGPFYKALALMKRNGSGDRQLAKALLEEVRDKQLPGSRQATQWLKNM